MKKCKVCKEKFKPTYSSVQMVCSPKCAYEYAKDKKKPSKIKEWKVDVYSKENKRNLQNEINKLARNIDTSFNYNCIDCGKPYRDKMDKHGSHFHNVQGNENLRFNLDNVHLSKSDCNKWHGGRKEDYYNGLIDRYDLEYADYIKFELKLKYPVTKLSNQEIADKLKIVRKINRTFDTYKFDNSKSARKFFNKMIGIYK